MNKTQQVLAFIILVTINIILYILEFPVWTYPTLCCAIIFAFSYYTRELTSFTTYSPELNPEFIKKKQKSLKESYIKELNIAKNVQEGLLSVETPGIEGIRVAKRCVPAQNIGGDFYTFIDKNIEPVKKGIVETTEYTDTEHWLGVAVGDVAGHGVSSALVMALSSGLISEIAKANQSPARTLRIANNNLQRYIGHSNISHVTAFYGILNPHSRKFIYSKAGHPPALLVHRDNTSQELAAEGLFLGMFPDEIYEEKEITLEQGDRLFIYTDGITETKNCQNKIFGINKLRSAIINNYHKPIEELMDIIFQKTSDFSESNEITDDQTMVIIEVT
ncbi:MAG: serine/threonine-protein phosphatase [bacterium]|nr:serine/threonine-protein phosphatase [bacterium]